MANNPTFNFPTFNFQTPSGNLSQIGQPNAQNLSQQKQAQVARASQAKQLMMNGGQNFDTLATAILEGNDLGQGDLAQELSQTGVMDLQNLYGQEVAALAAGLQNAMQRIESERNARRSRGEIAADTGLAAARGLVTGVGGVGALGAGIVNERAGQAVAETVQNAGEFIGDFQSPVLERKQELGAIRSELDQEDINRQYEEDLANGDQFAGLRRFGREFVAAGTDLAENPALLGDITAEGVGSLIGSAGLARVAATAGARVLLKARGMTDDAIRALLKTDEGADLVNQITTRGMPASIGLQEGGGVYTQVVNEISNMSEEELFRGSEEYRVLRSQNMSHADARRQIANAAGLEGGAVQAVIGAGTGKLVSRFETNPFRSGTGDITERLSEFGSNILKEGFEEGIQESTGGIVADAAIERRADEGRDIFEGAGSDAARGAAAGAGMAGALQAPGTALGVTGQAGRDIARAAGQGLQNRLNNVQEGLEEEGPTSNSKASEALERMSRNLNLPTSNVNIPASTVTLPPEEERQEEAPTAQAPEPVAPEAAEAPVVAEETPKSIRDLVVIEREEIAQAPKALLDAILLNDETGELDEIPENFGRGDLIVAAIQKMNDKNQTQEQTNEIALWLGLQAQMLEDLGERDLSAESDDVKNVIEETLENADIVLSNKTVKEALKRAQTLTAEQLGEIPTVTEQNIESPEVRKAIQSHTLLSQVNPTGVDPNFISTLLSQKKLKFSPSVLKGLKLAGEIAREANRASAEKAAVAEEMNAEHARLNTGKKAKTPTDKVREQIVSTGRDIEKGQFGLSKHQANVVQAMSRGDVAKAQADVDRLRGFAMSLNNKLQAARQSYQMKKSSDNVVNYDVWTGSAFAKGKGRIYISPFSPNHIQLGKEIAIDAASAATVYNNLIEEYGDQLDGELLQIDLKAGKALVVEDPRKPKVEETEAQETVLEEPDEGEITDESEGRTEEEESQTAQAVDEENQESSGETDQNEEGEEAETRQDDVVAEEETPAQTIPTFNFGNLPKSSDGVSRLEASVDISLERSILMQGERPISGVVNIFENFDQYAEALDLSTYLDKEKAKNFAAFVRQYAVPLAERMNERLKEPGNYNLKSKKKLTPLEAVKTKEVDFTGMIQGRSLNLIDTETESFDSRLLGSAVLAAMEWVLTEDAGKIPLDREDIAKIEGIKESDVTPKMLNAYNNYIRENTAKESLGRKIMEFWGARAKSDQSMSFSHGIAQGLAADILSAMEGTLIDKKTEPLKRENEGQPVNSVTVIRVTENEQFKKQSRDLGAIRGIMSEAFIPEAEPVRFLDEIPPEGKNERQKGNWIGRFSGTYKRALKKHREKVSWRNTNFINLMNDLGEEVYIEMMGGSDFDTEVTHIMDAESLDGRQKGLRRSFKETIAHDNAVLNKAQISGKSPEEVETRYQYYVLRNGRIMAVGFNGQTDKTMREAYPPTRNTIDLSDDQMHDLFWSTIAQMGGFAKTEIANRQEAVQKAQEVAFTQFAETIAGLENYLSTGEMSSETKAKIRADWKNGAEPHVLHALMEVARYNLATIDGRDSEAAKNYETFLPMELDGKTDGPFHVMQHFLTKRFSVRQLESFRRAGLFLNSRDVSLNDYLGEVDENGEPLNRDIYEEASNLTQANVNSLREAFISEGRKDLLDQHNSLLRILVRFGDLEIRTEAQEDGTEKNVLVIGRNVLKNPVTVKMYGSGDSGIANKIAAAVEETIYARISDLLKLRRDLGDESLWFDDVFEFASAEEAQTFDRDLQALFTQRLQQNDFGMKIQKLAPRDVQRFDIQRKPIWTKLYLKRGMPSEVLRKFVLMDTNMAMLSENIRVGLVSPMVHAIKTVTDNAQEGTVNMQAASNVMSVVVQEAFKSAVFKRKKDGLALSEDEIKEIYREVAPFAGVVESTSGTTQDSMHVNMTSAERSDLGFDLGRSMSDGYRGPTAMPGPSDAGVSAMPLVTISEGDARMMVQYYAGENPSLRTEQVFDGLNIAIADIMEGSQEINRSVAKAMEQNPLKHAADAFENFLMTDFLKEINDPRSFEKLFDIWDRLQKKPKGTTWSHFAPLEGKEVDVKLLRSELKKFLIPTLKSRLRKDANGAEARKKVMFSMGFSMDHMASAINPYNHEADIFDAATDAELVEEMNRRFDIELGKIQEDQDLERDTPPVQEPNGKLIEALKPFGKTEEGVTLMSVQAFKKVLESLDLDENIKTLLDTMSGSLADFRVVIGEKEDLTNWRNKRFPNQKSEGDIDLGLTDIENGVIYISNIAEETALHEMMHAVLGGLINDYYDDPGLMDETSRKAMENLEKLMMEFVELNTQFEDQKTFEVVTEVQQQLSLPLQVGTKELRAQAMNEFVAWTLTNQKLITLLKKKKTNSKLTVIFDKILKGLKRLLGLPSGTSLDMFSNIKWNTGVLMKANRLSNSRVRQYGASVSKLLHQKLDDPRLRELTTAFERKVQAYLSSPKGMEVDYSVEDFGTSILNMLSENGVVFNEAEASAFRMIQTAMATEMEMHKPSLIRTQKLFRHVMQNLKVEDLMETKGDEWNPADRQQAQDLFNILTGKVGVGEDPMGRSTMLSTFLALSQVSPTFRKMLSEKPVPSDTKIERGSLDQLLETSAMRMMDRLATSVVGGIGATGSTKEAMARLAANLARIERDNRTKAEKIANGLLTNGDHRGSDVLSDVSERMVKFSEKHLQRRDERKNLRDEAMNLMGGTVNAVAALMDEQKGKVLGSNMTSLANEFGPRGMIPQTLIKMMNEVFGITDENRGVLELLNRVKTAISGLRQDYRETLPGLLQEKFSRELTDEEKSSLQVMLAESDIAALTDIKDSKYIRELLLNPKRAVQDMKDTIEELRALDRSLVPAWQKKSKDLAIYMITGEAPKDHNLLRNATAVSLLFDVVPRNKIDPEIAAKAEPLIERLVTLMALNVAEDKSAQTFKTVEKLAEEEPDGVEFMINYLGLLRAREKKKATTMVAKINGYKGYIPSESKEGMEMKIADDSDYSKLVSLGYTRIGDYVGSGAERGKKGYYFSTVGGNNTFNQGVMQTVQKTANGVDIQTGRSLRGTTHGMTNSRTTDRIRKLIASSRMPSRGEPLIPIRDEDGNVKAYERNLDPKKLEALRRNKKIDEMIGAWAGRQAEEQLAETYNRILVDRVKEVWDRDKLGRRDEFIDLSDPELDNQIWKDGWDLVPPETKDYIKEVFGEDGFMVRLDMLDNTMGYRAMSLGEAWKGPSELPETVKKGIMDVTTAIMGKNAYRNVVVAEKAWQAGVSVAKQTIVIRSVVVPMSNIASNVVQLMGKGVPIRNIVGKSRQKLVEIDKHLKNEKRRVEIEAEMSQFKEDSVRYRKLMSERQALTDASKRMSIWPLIEAGEFATISEGLTDADAAISEGRWADWMNAQIDKLPAQLGTAGRYAMITRDTALFQGMSRVVQYGDFIAKAVLYDHLVDEGMIKKVAPKSKKYVRVKMNPKEALDYISEEFVNYNLLPGQVRSYSESMGLAWFWAYKLRSIKVAHRQIRDNPLRALMTTWFVPMLPEPLNIEASSPLFDNAANVVLEGRAGYSLGTGMLWNAPSLLPWFSLTE